MRYRSIWNYNVRVLMEFSKADNYNYRCINEMLYCN